MRKNKKNTTTLIGDSGIVESKDIMGYLTILICTLVSIGLIALGTLALLNA